MKETSQAKPKAPLIGQLRSLSAAGGRCLPMLFVCFLFALYGFVAFQIVNARSATPGTNDVAAHIQAVAAPHVDPQTITEMQTLQDNSVNVKALFDQARSNPFHE